MLKDFRAFVLRGNVVDLAVGVIIGLAFATVVGTFTDLVTNLVAIPGSTDFSSLSFSIGGGVFRYGLFLNAVINFVIVAAVLFFAVVRPLQRLAARRQPGNEEPARRDCPYCLEEIPARATRCGHCTANLGETGPAAAP